jgi:glycosyltransferase involved in cell wall biosynthesis
MRIALVVHGFPPLERTGVENYTAALAAALARAGHAVLVFVPRVDPRRAHGSQRRERRGATDVHWVADNVPPTGVREALDRPVITREFGRFLERERPDVVHFQHLVKLGMGLVFEARARGIPTVYTAHDYFPICHRYTLLRPDLTHCDVRGDSMACARCDLAASFLDGRSARLGDYQMGALPAQLSPAESDALAALLGGHPEQAGFSEADQDAACDQRRELDSLRARAFVALDRILAPTSYLARELVRGGIERKKIHPQPYGIPTDDLRDLPAIRPDLRAPVRIGYLGGFSKQKGVHVLLAAAGRMRARAELVLHGGGSDREYVELVTREARRVGARLGGPYERADLPRLLSGLDLVVVPSIWAENYPIVIREAFAARRPVVASACGALPESVRDGLDGRLVQPNDAQALARVLDELCAPGVLETLAANAPEVKTIEQEALELVTHYRAVQRVQSPRPLPASLAGFVGDVERLERLPIKELFTRALAGVARLRSALRPQAPRAAEELVAAALQDGSLTQTLLRDLRREKDWIDEQARALLAELGGRPASSSAEPGWPALHARVRGLQEELGAVVGELFRVTAADPTPGKAPAPRAPVAQLLQALRERRETFAAQHAELAWRRETFAAQHAELAWRRETGARQEAELAWRVEQLEDLGREVEWRRGKVAELETEVARLRDELERMHADGAAREREAAARLAELGRVAEERRLELAWRRDEMEALKARLRRGILRLAARGALARRVQGWPPPGGGAA